MNEMFQMELNQASRNDLDYLIKHEEFETLRNFLKVEKDILISKMIGSEDINEIRVIQGQIRSFEYILGFPERMIDMWDASQKSDKDGALLENVKPGETTAPSVGEEVLWT